MVVHVYPNGPGHDLRNARINPVARRMQPCGPEQHRTAGAHRSGQEFPSRKAEIATLQHTAHSRSSARRRFVEEAMKKFPEEGGIARFGKPEVIPRTACEVVRARPMFWVFGSVVSRYPFYRVSVEPPRGD
jgi:hypothetical protein